MHKLLTWCVAVLLSFSVAAEQWKVTSLDWQPFSGAALPEGGAGVAVLRAALKAEGIDLVVEFYPWTRAMETAKDPAYAGYFPAWPEDVVTGFVASPVLFRSAVGFVEPKAAPLVWSKLEDLRGKTIGTVQDYGNTPEFMRLIQAGTIKTQVVINDLTNIRKVAGGRIDGAFIDLTNLRYLLKNDARDLAAKVQANARVIDNKDLLLAINTGFANKNAVEVLRRGLSKIDADKIIKDYMARYIR